MSKMAFSLGCQVMLALAGSLAQITYQSVYMYFLHITVTSHGMTVSFQELVFQQSEPMEAASLWNCADWHSFPSPIFYQRASQIQEGAYRFLPFNGEWGMWKDLWPFLSYNILNQTFFVYNLEMFQFTSYSRHQCADLFQTGTNLVFHRHNLTTSCYEPLTSCPGHFWYYFVEGS